MSGWSEWFMFLSGVWVVKWFMFLIQVVYVFNLESGWSSGLGF